MSSETIDYSRHPAVINFQNYLKIRCVHPDINYDECINFLKGQAAELELVVQVHMMPGNKPVLVMTWEGLEPGLETILLNSHMDVVPAEGNWKHPPFSAEIEDGVIFGRGVQDMKCVSIQYLEAIRRLKSQGTRLRRTVHLTFVPEEEKGGTAGMGEFVKTEAFRALHAGFALDEGLSSPGEEFLVFNGEKSMWHVKITCTGKAVHGSMLLPENSGEKGEYRFPDALLKQVIITPVYKSGNRDDDVSNYRAGVLNRLQEILGGGFVSRAKKYVPVLTRTPTYLHKDSVSYYL